MECIYCGDGGSLNYNQLFLFIALWLLSNSIDSYGNVHDPFLAVYAPWPGLPARGKHVLRKQKPFYDIAWRCSQEFKAYLDC